MPDAYKPLSEDEILAHIGTLLINVQQFEYLLSAALKQIFADQKDLTPEKLFAIDRRTLGKLLTALSNKAPLDAGTSALLKSLLAERNYFVHYLGSQGRLDLRTDAGRDRAMDFLGPFTEKLLHAIRLFLALHVKHSDDIGFRSVLMEKIRTDPVYKVSEHYQQAAKLRKKRK